MHDFYFFYKSCAGIYPTKWAYCIFVDWTGPVKWRLVKRGLVKRGLVKCGLVQRNEIFLLIETTISHSKNFSSDLIIKLSSKWLSRGSLLSSSWTVICKIMTLYYIPVNVCTVFGSVWHWTLKILFLVLTTYNSSEICVVSRIGCVRQKVLIVKLCYGTDIVG